MKNTGVGAGMIDNDCRRNILVPLFNFSNIQLNITRGDRIAQFILTR